MISLVLMALALVVSIDMIASVLNASYCIALIASAVSIASIFPFSQFLLHRVILIGSIVL